MEKTLRWIVRLSWKDALVSVLPMALVATLGLWVAYHFIDPAPPKTIAIATGSDDSAYLDFANQYRRLLAQDGVTLELQTSGGALDNLVKLRDQDDASRVAFLQDGLAGSDADSSDASSAQLLSLGSVSYEPIWIFYRGQRVRSRISELAGMRIAIGAPNTSTQVFATRLLQASGVTAHNAQWLPLSRDEALRQLNSAQVDAAFFIDAPDSALVKSLVRQAHVRTMNLDQAEAYGRRFPYLHPVLLPHGTLDLLHNLPAQDLHLLATTTTVVVTENLHPALIALLMKAMQKTHATPDLINAAHEFPSAKDSDFALSKDAEHFYQSGPPFLQRYLPFWLATLVDRAALAILPVLAILVPVLRAAPGIYAWRIRRRIYRWYGELKYLETQLRSLDPQASREALIHQVDQIEEKVTHAVVPLPFAEHVYVLKEHMELVRRKMRQSTT